MKFGINETVTNKGNLEVNDLEVVQSMTMTSQMRLDKSYNLPQIGLAKSHNLTMPRTDLGISSGIKPTFKLTKSLTKSRNKVYKPKAYNKAIDNLIYGNRWCRAIDKKLGNLDSN